MCFCTFIGVYCRQVRKLYATEEKQKQAYFLREISRHIIIAEFLRLSTKKFDHDKNSHNSFIFNAYRPPPGVTRLFSMSYKKIKKNEENFNFELDFFKKEC
jgi:hypothetical protein